MIETLRNWLAGLEPRERGTLVIGAGVLAAGMIYVLAVDPILSHLENQERRVAARRADAAWMRQAAAELMMLRSTVAPSASSGDSLLALADRTAKEAGLGPGMRRVMQESQQAEGVRLRFEDVPFDELVRWLGILHADYGVAVTSITVERSSAEGLVNASILLERPAA